MPPGVGRSPGQIGARQTLKHPAPVRRPVVHQQDIARLVTTCAGEMEKAWRRHGKRAHSARASGNSSGPGSWLATRVSVVVRPCVAAAAGLVEFTIKDTCAVLDGFGGR